MILFSAQIGDVVIELSKFEGRSRPWVLSASGTHQPFRSRSFSSQRTAFKQYDQMVRSHQESAQKIRILRAGAKVAAPTVNMQTENVVDFVARGGVIRTIPMRRKAAA